jgi:cyclic beta-1,2-glucan synthetase
MRFFTRRSRLPESTPLRGEVLSLESLEVRAKTLAAAFTLARDSRTARYDVLARLAENLGFLRRAYGLLAGDVHRGDAVDPAVEWLLDNFHLLETQARLSRCHSWSCSGTP